MRYFGEDWDFAHCDIADIDANTYVDIYSARDIDASAYTYIYIEKGVYITHVC